MGDLLRDSAKSSRGGGDAGTLAAEISIDINDSAIHFSKQLFPPILKTILRLLLQYEIGPPILEAADNCEKDDEYWVKKL